MKFRCGFVSNSSSSSFILDRKNLSYEQDQLLTKLCAETNCGWQLFTTYGSFIGYTVMDNFNMREFLTKIGVDNGDVVWSNNVLKFPDDWPKLEEFKSLETLEALDKKFSERLDNILKDMDYNENVY